jgi:hypothetical protein
MIVHKQEPCRYICFAAWDSGNAVRLVTVAVCGEKEYSRRVNCSDFWSRLLNLSCLLICSLRKQIHDRCLISVKKRQGDGSPVPVKFHSGRVLTRRHNSCWDYDSKDAVIMAPRTEASTWGRHDKCPKFSRSWITCSTEWSSVTIIKWWLFQHPNYKFLSTLYFLIIVLVST